MAVMNKRYLVLLAFLACLTGCVPVDSLNPLYSDSDLISDDALIGQWVPVDQSQKQLIFQFEKAKGPSYVLQVSEKNKSDKLFYVVRLVAIGKNRFLDVSPADVHVVTLDDSLKALQSKSGKNLEPPLFHLGLGAYLELAGSTQNEAHIRRAHWFFRFRFDGKKFGLDGTDDKKFMQAMESNKLRIDTGFEKGREVLITASTKDLQKFVMEHIDDDSFFTQHAPEMERMQAQ
jgi:hypothetical protein